MEQHDREELAEVNAARKGFYEFLASMYKLELTDEQIETLAKQDLPADAEYVGAGYATVKEYLRHRDAGTRQELAVDYARVFLCAGMYEQLMAPPYESVYTSEEHLLMQDARDSAVAFYLSTWSTGCRACAPTCARTRKPRSIGASPTSPRAFCSWKTR